MASWPAATSNHRGRAVGTAVRTATKTFEVPGAAGAYQLMRKWGSSREEAIPNCYLQNWQVSKIDTDPVNHSSLFVQVSLVGLASARSRIAHTGSFIVPVIPIPILSVGSIHQEGA